jgi:hypothetical protein
MGLMFVVGEHNVTVCHEERKGGVGAAMGLILGNRAASRANGVAQHSIA